MVGYGKNEKLAGGYVPYFYEAGHYLWKPLSSGSTLKKLYNQPSSGYDFSSDSPKPFFHAPQSVEQVIQRGYLAVPKSEPEIAVIGDKQRTSWQGLDDIIRQVRRRHDIYQKNIYQIEQGVCHAINAIYKIQAYRGGVPVNSKERYSITKQMRELYEQERDERVKLWQDVSRLKQQLPETAQQYLSAYRKVSILNNKYGDLN